MALLVQLLQLLERQDTLPAPDALEKVFVDQAEPWDESSVALLWQSVSPESQAGLSSWAEQRLDHWHSLKSNALRSAWENDPGSQVEHQSRCDTMLRAMLLDLRSGLQRHPELAPDALALQRMAESGHAFSWSQAYRELREDNPAFDLDAQSPDLILYCQLGTYAFRWLLGGEVGS